MKRLLKALEKAGLVELEGGAEATAPAEADTANADAAVTTEVLVPQTRRDPGPMASPDAAAGGDLAVAEARPFEAIYADHALAASPFPAERLLKVLDGLAALEPSARKTAVAALDAADDAWTIDDSVLDAERKVRILETYRGQVEEDTRGQLAQAKAQAEARDQQHQANVARIRQQIADLEGLLEREVARAAQETEQIHAQARACKDACARETARVDDEVARLRRIAEIFAAPAPAAATRPPH